ncbi:enoyl-CoA hydratase-related protein [Vibrio nigripulchritudo]|uniref:enoyl-CoA hydratase-related protein n=1 Tax=Vibrio nigripulchritudo TaxID=28173 RepID=UPI0024926F8F|nr:enoyl-CoA hydratase-related protein [Vibrio nigripulchritudo]BDU39671.1 carnitinyl-CoA dehydratase [Vibrio nigripulchritudo]BDU45393.1 carnitinyl-CoA dehydratase [Vibrio nigripulchritudo]
MTASIKIQQQNHILIVTLDRPKANAIDSHTSREIYEVFEQFENDNSLEVAIVTGAGEKFFSAGWDLKAALNGEAVDENHGPGGFAGITEYFDVTKPVIAAVNGFAVGGGFELALSCDLVIASDNAQFFLPEGQIGIVPDAGGVFRLSERIPRAIAMEMMLTGKRLNATEAYSMGLVNDVVSPDELMSAAVALAERIRKTAPLSQRAIKELVSISERHDIQTAFEIQRSGSLKNYSQMLRSEDAKEGAIAFAEGREPVWKGC